MSLIASTNESEAVSGNIVGVISFVAVLVMKQPFLGLDQLLSVEKKVRVI